MENKVLAVVNGREIKQSDVALLYQNLGPNAAQYQGEKGYKQLVDQLVLEEMLYSDAKESNLDQEEGYQVALEQLKKSLLAQYLVGKIMSDIKITEDEAKEYYEKNKSTFVNGEMVKASHILVKTVEEANDILKEINEGLTFADAAKKYSSCPSKEAGGSLGQFGKGQMVPEFESAVFAMKVGEVSEPVKTQFGFHIIKLDEKEEQKELSFDEAKTEIENKLKYEKQNKVYTEKQNALKEKYTVEYKL
ncbi:peptidylprolyl isomerase [Sedimentibacter sp. zth1]|uniref:peptidylprolyl isomerase n=1 Tax=Sedimentibacter sp. zth1 TaxID=2816908 RepID=UPI001A92C60E|nr:peptidylprolyl isomerase [Sedimentibacter sp. zth1]QSX06067.1 peptidylprolyl isomerase [Sedimentibacter sp. zth1]